MNIKHDYSNRFISWKKLNNQIDILVYKSSDFECMISLQGAQLLSWKPIHSTKNQTENQTKHHVDDIIFMSSESEFIKGKPIRGGVPICWPWFGNKKKPSHGFARIVTWEVDKKTLFADEKHLNIDFILQNNYETEKFLHADFKLIMQFKISQEKCSMSLKYETASADYFGDVSAALHTYFKVGDIKQTRIQNLGTSGFNTLNAAFETFDDPLSFDVDSSDKFDCVFTNPHANPHAEDKAKIIILDKKQRKKIVVNNHNAPNIVVWNPMNSLFDMSLKSSREMLCIEAAFLDKNLLFGETLKQTITYGKLI